MKRRGSTFPLLLPVILCLLAVSGLSFGQLNSERIRVILDTNANNELDDQHAIACLLFNGDVFDVEWLNYILATEV